MRIIFCISISILSACTPCIRSHTEICHEPDKVELWAMGGGVMMPMVVSGYDYECTVCDEYKK